ncbi:MAG: hypothetical protein JSW27_14800 [Phycisphaerales bacterium]|nr:MAG: hypothetical protein JSW27_14800 [Phycisphaerales bacterium]
MLLGLFLPYLVIPAQVIVLIIPTVGYTWKWGPLHLVTGPERGDMDAQVHRAG